MEKNIRKTLGNVLMDLTSPKQSLVDQVFTNINNCDIMYWWIRGEPSNPPIFNTNANECTSENDVGINAIL